VVQAFRTGEGIGWHEHDQDVFAGCERFFRPGYTANLLTAWLPALDGMEARLREGAKVADIGCGLGASTILMAGAYPRSAFTGFDYHEGSVTQARSRAADAGAGGVTFETAAAQTFGGGMPASPASVASPRPRSTSSTRPVPRPVSTGPRRGGAGRSACRGGPARRSEGGREAGTRQERPAHVRREQPVVDAIRRVGREVPGAGELIAAQCRAHDYSDPGKPDIAWDDRQAKEALVSALVNDALKVVAASAEAAAEGRLEDKAAQALALLALVAGQDVEPADDDDGTGGRWKIARKVAEDRVISTIDPQTRHVHKTVHHRLDGYKAHVATEPGSGLFTGVKLTKASGDDNHEVVVGLKVLQEEDRGDDGGLDVLGDTAYGSGQARAALEQAGHTVIIKPAPLRPAVAPFARPADRPPS
jgi:hypothetical protein